MRSVAAIPTTYRGLQMRSRLEATWASFFDVCGWKWEYEPPLELHGYIPDFVLRFKRPIIVECKPGWDLWEFTGKLDRSGWTDDMLIVGSGFIESHLGWPAIGILRERIIWAPAQFHRCTQCNSVAFCHEEFSHHCRVCHAYGGEHFLEIGENELQHLWAQAKNQVQWQPQMT